MRVVIAVLAMAAIVMVAAPVKNFLQERVDRFFYGERYDLRLSLLDFGRTLSATTALDPLLDALVNRLQEVMNVGRIAIFVEDERTKSGYVVARAEGLSLGITVPSDFREMIRVRSAETGVVRADDMDLCPSLPGLSDVSFITSFLASFAAAWLPSSDWVALRWRSSFVGRRQILRTVSGYVAVAIENSLLYQEQQERAGELKLLKEFNESIIESINVGLLAVDSDGRVTRLNWAMSTYSICGATPRSESASKNYSQKILLTRYGKCWVRRLAAKGDSKHLQDTHGTSGEPLTCAQHRNRTACRMRKNKRARWSWSKTSRRASGSRNSCSNARNSRPSVCSQPAWLTK